MKLQEVYNERSRTLTDGIFLWFRALYYEYFIIPTISNFFEENNINQNNFDIVLERWSWRWNKLEKIRNNLVWQNTKLYWVEPSEWMRERSKKRFKWNWNTKLIDWFAEELHFEDWTVDMIYDIQMQHHHPLQKREEMISEAYRVLKRWWILYILDTYKPSSDGSFGKVKNAVFDILMWKYSKKFWKGQYYNDEICWVLELLDKNWFEIDKKYSRWFKAILWCFYWHDMIDQIIAIKK